MNNIKRLDNCMTIADEAEQIAFCKAVSDLSSRLNQNLFDDDDKDRFSYQKWALLCSIDLAGIVTPVDFGGSGLDIVTTMKVLEALGYGCEDTGLSFSLCSHLISAQIPVSRNGNMQMRRAFLPNLATGSLIGAHAVTESQAGSDIFAMEAFAEKSGDQYIINGEKSFVTNGPIADVFVVYVWTDKSRGILGGLSAFLVEKETPGFLRGDGVKKMGLRSSPLGPLFFNNCRVPNANLIGGEGKGYSILTQSMNWETLCTSALHLGEIRRIIEKCINYSKNRVQYGQPISKYQAVSHKLVDMEVGLKAAASVTYDAGRNYGSGAINGKDIAIAKLLVSETYVKTSLDAIQIFGAYGYMRESGIERSLRDSVASKIYSGSNEIQRNKIAAMLRL